MGSYGYVYRTKAIANATTSGNTELVIALLSNVDVPRAGQNAGLDGWASVTTGANITSIRLRIYRGVDATGTLVADSGVVAGGVAASTLSSVDVSGIDVAPGELAQGSYAMTLTTAGASPGNSTIGFVSLRAEIYN